jgi:hypothetical protein
MTRTPTEPDTRPAGWHPLTAGHDAGGLRLMLDGRPVSMGTGLELLLPGGASLHVRVEGAHARPRLHLAMGGPWEALAREPRCECDRPDFGADDERRQRCATCGRLSDLTVYCAPELVATPAYGARDLVDGARAFEGVWFRWP